MSRYLLFFVLGFFFSSCGYYTHSTSYWEDYSYLKKMPEGEPIDRKKEENFVIFFVDARHLDYSSSHALIKSLQHNPMTKRKRRDVGHAWIYLEGTKDGRKIVWEGGHTGEWGVSEPTYLQGVMNYIAYGYANPTKEEKRNPRKEENPIKWLWAPLGDGCLQKGSGGHRPTFAAKVRLSEEKFKKLLAFVDEKNYHYQRYALRDHQCSSFLAEAASVIGLYLQDKVTVSIDKKISIGGREIELWQDERYATITFSSPDRIEKSLVEAVLKS